MHSTSLHLALAIAALFGTPFLLDLAVTRYTQRRAHMRAVSQRLRDMQRDSLDRRRRLPG